jgi:hypothetical protein
VSDLIKLGKIHPVLAGEWLGAAIEFELKLGVLIRTLKVVVRKVSLQQVRSEFLPTRN